MSTTTFPALFAWKPEYSVGHWEIDEQHRKLIAILNSLHEAMLSRKTAQQLSITLNDLVQYTQRHFASEERIMRENQYPAIAAHRKQHDQFTTQVLGFQAELAAGRAALSIEVMHFLKDWLSNHILNEDRAIGSYLRSKERQIT
jgi:hemerythrin